MNAPCEDVVSPPNATTKGQNDRKRKGLHVKCMTCDALYPGHFKRNEIERMKAYGKNYSHGFRSRCHFSCGGKEVNREYLDSKSKFVENIRILIAKMIIIGKLPLNFVKNEGFRRFMQQSVRPFCPEFVIPSLATVTRDILEIYKREKALMRTMIVDQNSTVSLTVNTWTSDQDMNYIVLTGHFINLGWKIQRRILNFRQIENLRGETIGREVEKCLKQWSIKNILTLTVDNAPSNDTAISYLVDRFKNGLVLDGNFVNVRCCAHILKLIVCDVMEDFHELISKVRNAVRFVRSSPTRYRSFEKCIEEENLSNNFVCLDVPTQWDNTYVMLESAEKFEKAFERLGIHDTTFLNEDIPASGDWEVIRTLVQFISLFYKASLRLSGSVHVLSNTVFHEIITIQNYIKKHSSNSDNLVLNDIAMKIQAKYDKYWGNDENANYLLYIAVVLDPRYKMKFLLYCFSELFGANVAKEMCKKVEDILRQLFSEYRLLIRDYHDSPTSSMDGYFNTRTCTTDDEDIFDDEAYHLKDMFEKVKEEDKNVDAATEVDLYLLEPLVDKFKEFDLLKYWWRNCHRFRVLSEITREILAIPVSTIASESAFKIGGRMIDSTCLTLAPNLVEVLACLQNWLNTDNVGIDLREHIKDIIGMEEA
ncbi:zinc finger BED domain-containing protein RICESLEEPER 2-like isoform X2 [Momordica charantia]|uniref:Zinc finger BED domain-containing protein RICESLEEPER 2-like isoform X2 n=1 Tax=Momordica charantia TaxID=3673 RepID=A0A6J1DFA9_MOMCH|nr:zinc finger BED domain-containing protein RICESLEEPER 2-like isoform X2 [Momordica charantia]